MTHTAPDPPRATLTLIGLDARGGQYWTWRWNDEPWATPHRLEPAASEQVGWLLASAIPGLASRTPAERRAPHPLGWLAHAESEWSLACRLAALLLPARLRVEVAQRALAGRIRVRVHPSGSTVTVPWELLPVGERFTSDRRLLDVADVAQVAPLLPRDVGAAPPGRAWAEASALPALRLVDPDLTDEGLGRVLSVDALRAWRASEAAEVASGGSVFGERADRRWLSRSLPGRSRFLFVGHVTAGSDPWGTGLVLGCRRSVYATGRAEGVGFRSLTARDLRQGTLGIAAVASDAAACRDRFGAASLTEDAVPTAAWDAAAEEPLAMAGDRLWPMPPRVGLIGCRSGPDLAHAEPSGLVTAVLAAGAELVVATRWTLYSARTFAHWGSPGDALADAARAVDACLAASDPIGSLSAWQRARLDAWRGGGALADSPLLWAALTSTDARPRTVGAAAG